MESRPEGELRAVAAKFQIEGEFVEAEP